MPPTNPRPPHPPCHYCGRRPNRNRRLFRRRGFFADGSDFTGHRSCFMEFTNPDHPTLGHARWDVPVGGRR
jgi:hypothetical protein